MEDYSEASICVRCSLPVKGLALLTNAEIDATGFAILLCRGERSPRVLGFTLGLSNLGHCEVMTVGGSDDEVFALLAHLAEQVTRHGQSFSVGSQCTSVFSDLFFRQAPCGLHDLDIVREICGEEIPTWLVCDEPLSFTSLGEAPHA
jgi:hypothetical protein